MDKAAACTIGIPHGHQLHPAVPPLIQFPASGPGAEDEPRVWAPATSVRYSNAAPASWPGLTLCCGHLGKRWVVDLCLSVSLSLSLSVGCLSLRPSL